MDGALHLPSLKAAARLRFRIIGRMHHGYIAAFIRLVGNTLHKVCVHEAYFISGIEPLVFRNRLCHEVIRFNPQLTGEGNGPASQLLILEVVGCFQLLTLSFRIVVNDELQRMQDRQHPAAGRL